MKPYRIICIFHLEYVASLEIRPDGKYECYKCGRNGNIEENNYLFSNFQYNVMKYKEEQGQLKLKHVN